MASPLAALLVSATLFAHAGEQVTREDGTVICTLTQDMYRETVVGRPDEWCRDWTIARPSLGGWWGYLVMLATGRRAPDDPPGYRWVRQNGPQTIELHVGDSWR